jgi:hypothetical protein
MTRQSAKKKKIARKRPAPGECFLFPQVKGKKVDSVELWADMDTQSVTVWFQDRTCLHFDLAPSLTVRTEYFAWKNGEQRTIKRWPPVRSVGS